MVAANAVIVNTSRTVVHVCVCKDICIMNLYKQAGKGGYYVKSLYLFDIMKLSDTEA